MADDVSKYWDKLKVWAMGAAAVLALSVASALANRWLGAPVQLPAPPVIIVQPNADGTTPAVRVLDTNPKGK